MATQTQLEFLFIFIISIINLLQLCESQSSQNIETFYPFSAAAPPPPPSTGSSAAPLPPTPTPPNPPLPLSPPDTSSHSTSSASRKAIFTAVGVTAATTLVLAAAVFFLFTRYAAAQRKKQRTTTAFAAAGGSNGGRLQPQAQTEFTRFDGNIKGLIVDEDGLDVLYWKKLEGSQQRKTSGPFHKEAFNKPGSGKRVYSIARGKSSSSQNTQIHPQDDQKARLLDSKPTEADFQALPPPPPLPPVPTKNRPTPPPPPPPLPGKKGPAPPPPPPVSGRKGPPPPPKGVALASSSKPPTVPRRTPSGNNIVEVSAIEEDESAAKNEKVKLKPLHWEKVNVNPDHSMVWDKIDRGSFQCNVDMMEALFGYVATNRKSPPQDGTSASQINENLSPAAKIFILDSRRSQNAAIVIRSLGISRKELIEGLLEGTDLNVETLEKLNRITPTREEKIKILAFDGDVGRLADVESFLFHLLKAVPSAFNRTNAMLFRFTYGSEIHQLKDALKTLDSACTELRSSRVFTKLLEAILKAGNRLNAGTSRGNAQAFNLTALLKLSDYKSSDGKTTLLHFVVHEVVRNEGRRCVMIRNNSQKSSSSSSDSKLDDTKPKEEQEREFLKLGLPVVGGLCSELQNVKKAATIDYDTISSSSSSMTGRISETRQLVLKCRADGAGEFVKEMKEFLRGADREIKEVKEEQTKVMEFVKKTAEYYQAGTFKDRHPIQLFVIVNNFVGIIDRACIDIARSLQQRKANTNTSASPSSPPTPDVLRTRVTFPRLPDNFLSEKSNSSDSEDDR